jgi:hypothetical protein
MAFQADLALHSFTSRREAFGIDQFPRTTIPQGERVTGIVIHDPLFQVFCLADIKTACGFALKNVYVEWQWRNFDKVQLVEPMGFEPTASSMPSRRAPNCATAPPGLGINWSKFYSRR